MEFIPDARMITDFVDENGWSLNQRLEMFRNVCEAVHYGHQRGILHRDLKPQNILVNREGQAKVIDFGLARSSDANASFVADISDEGQLIGTLKYMSPEQCELGMTHDVRADVYSLGVVLYQLCCNRLPHELTGIPLPEALRIVQQDLPTRSSRNRQPSSRDIEAIIFKAIDKDPERRYRSVDAMRTDLQRFLNHETVEARTPTVWSPKLHVCTTQSCFGRSRSGGPGRHRAGIDIQHDVCVAGGPGGSQSDRRA